MICVSTGCRRAPKGSQRSLPDFVSLSFKLDVMRSEAGRHRGDHHVQPRAVPGLRASARAVSATAQNMASTSGSDRTTVIPGTTLASA
jgi:hypothetical protein